MKRSLLFILVLSAVAAPSLLAFGAQQQGHAKRGAAFVESQKNPAHAKVSGKDASGAKKEPEASAEKPRVRQINETELKSLMDASVKSGRPLLINFWATWCGPCREEFPDLVRFADEFQPKGSFDFITVSLDDVSDIETAVPEFLQTMRAGRIPAYLLNATDSDAAINLIDKEWGGELPATFLFGRKGELAYKHSGMVKPTELRAEVERALAAKE